MVLLRLTSDDGIIGLGEAVPLSLRGGAGLEQVVRELNEADQSEALHDLVEDPRPEYFEAAMIDPRLTLSPPSQFAVLSALNDLQGQVIGDRSESTAVQCNATLVAGEPAAVAADALEWAYAGFTVFKLKLGTSEDVDRVRAVRAAVGPAMKIRVDANAAWSLQTAARILDELEPLDIELVEQPVATMEEAAELSKLTSIPLSGDESVVSGKDAIRAVGMNAFQLTGIKLSKVGGVFEGLEISEAMPAYASSALDGPVGIAAGASFAGTLNLEHIELNRPLRAHGLATQRLFASTIAAVECELRDGMLHTPPGPGLGVVIDEDALDAHRL
jgi:L-alanine-DL-glutamate epimerase-like enolase superfamily enzyme